MHHYTGKYSLNFRFNFDSAVWAAHQDNFYYTKANEENSNSEEALKAI